MGAAHDTVGNSKSAFKAGSNGYGIIHQDLARKRFRGLFDESIHFAPQVCFESAKCVRETISRSGVSAKVAAVFSAIEPQRVAASGATS
jgi:hypothetical protein